MLFRELNETEICEFEQWARDNYTPGDTIDRDLWHPVIVAQCEKMNTEKKLEGEDLEN